jgi:hypothetical protein
MRLMAYLAIAEGAKGIVWFHGYGSLRDEHLVERTGHPRGGMMSTLSDLGQRLIPIGQQLLRTDPLEDVELELTQLSPGDAEHAVTVSVLQHRTAKIHYLVAINEDLDHTRQASAAFADEAILANRRGVYDLYALDGLNLADGKRSFRIAPLAGGDGRLYAVCTKDEYEGIRTAILCATALEELRALSPDLAIARRWGLDLKKVDKSIRACKAAASTGRSEQAIAEAHDARTTLFEQVRNHSQLAAARRALRDLRIELTEVLRIAEHYSLEPNWWTGRDHPMCVPNPALLNLAKRYWTVGRSYRDCYAKYLKGEKEGLWTEVRKTRLDCLTMRQDVLAFLREKLEPNEKPAR